MIEEDNDQDDNDISLLEFEIEEELMNEDTNKQDEVEEQDEQHFDLASNFELTFNKKKVSSWTQMCGLQTQKLLTT